MKKITLYFGFFFLPFSFQSSIYDLQIESISGNNISMSSYANKKILITTISSVSPDIIQIEYLDSLQNSDSALRIIAVPAKDLGGSGNDAILALLADSLGIDITITKSAYVKKSAGSNQHPLFRWLTDVNENSHFDMDVEAIGQLFIVSRNGVLYSVLGNDVPVEILSQILSQNVNQ